MYSTVHYIHCLNARNTERLIWTMEGRASCICGCRGPTTVYSTERWCIVRGVACEPRPPHSYLTSIPDILKFLQCQILYWHLFIRPWKDSIWIAIWVWEARTFCILGSDPGFYSYTNEHRSKESGLCRLAYRYGSVVVASCAFYVLADF
jgi:hypothetical protein